MSFLGWLTGSSSSNDDDMVARLTIHDEKNGEYELIASVEDYKAVTRGTEHTVSDIQPYEEPRRKLFGIF